VFAQCAPLGLNPACGDDVFDLRVVDALPPNPADPGKGSFAKAADFNDFTGRVGLNYRLNDDWMVFTSVAYGNKPGGLQARVVNVLDTNAAVIPELVVKSFDPETMTAYEFGLKGRTMDGRVGVDASVFFNDWKDIVLRQITENSPNTGRKFQQPEAFNFNAGSAEVFGWELSADVRLTETLTGRLTVNFQDAQLTKARQDTFEPFPSFAPNGDVSGNKLLRQPTWMSSASLSYDRQLYGDWDMFARTDVNFQDKVYVGNDNQSWLPPRTVVNLRFGVKSARYTVAFYARNLFNNDSPTGAFRDIFFSNTSNIVPPFVNQGPRPSFDKFVPLRLTVSYPNLRTFGMTVQVRFGGLAGEG